MKIAESGIILFSEHYEAAVAFYRDSLGLPVRERQANPTVLRLDVADFDATVTALRQKNILVSVDAFTWGKIGSLMDSEGNRIELKDAKEKQA